MRIIKLVTLKTDQILDENILIRFFNHVLINKTGSSSILSSTRLFAIDRLYLFIVLRDARDWSESGHQQEVIFR